MTKDEFIIELITKDYLSYNEMFGTYRCSYVKGCSYCKSRCMCDSFFVEHIAECSNVKMDEFRETHPEIFV